MTTTETTDHVRLDRALLCVDCEAIYNLPAGACPACGSESSLPLSRVLNRDNSELVEGLRALSKLLVWAKRPPRRP